MAITASPDWLKSRNAEMRPSKDNHVWTVYFAGQPQYLIEPLPGGGRFTCRVTQAVNGKRVEKPSTYATREEALQGGLRDLREHLGW